MWRAHVIFTLIILAFVLIVARLFYWQVIASDALRQQASDQYYLQLTLPATRGQILASDGAPLAMNVPSFLAYAQPKQVISKDVFASEVAPILKTDQLKLLSDISANGRVWVPLAKHVDTDTKNTLQGLHLDGLGFEPTSNRYYPEASMAAHLLGFVGSDQFGNDKGYFGLEGYYDRGLRGQDGYEETEKDVQGAPIPVGEVKRIEPQNGGDLTLWIDRTIQKIVEDRLAQGIAKYGAKQGTVTVMDPKTGGILAMAAYPGFDPRSYTNYDRSLYANPIVTSSYEPGSTFKVLVMSGAIQENKVKADTKMDESGPAHVDGYDIRTWNNQYHGPITMAQILEYSSNVGMVWVQQQMGRDNLLKYIHAYGFGEPTGIDVQGESSPELRSDNEWADIDLATSSFGQGIAVTPIQMVRAVGALANGGALMEPHIVRGITDANGKKVEIPPKKIRQVVDNNTASILTEMMIQAVDLGEAKWAKPAGYRIAGKTGTAQVPVAGHYDPTKTIASFVGFAPADDPKFVMLVTLTEPSSSIWGSETAAPLFFNIAKDMFNYYGIPPSP